MGWRRRSTWHRYGWPVAQGGSGAITQAMAAALAAHGGTVTTGVTVADRSDIPGADVVMLDLGPVIAHRIHGDLMPGRIERFYSAARSPKSPTPNVNAHKARWHNGRSRSSGSNTSPTHRAAQAMSTRYGLTRTCRSATPAMPPASSTR
jgi:phytoene dehydrogenase-like protein